jgi:hypothetical protein
VLEPAPVDPDGVTEQHQGQGGFGQVADELGDRVGVDEVQELVAGQQAKGDKDHGLADRGGPQPPRHRAIGDQHDRDGREGPMIHAHS